MPTPIPPSPSPTLASTSPGATSLPLPARAVLPSVPTAAASSPLPAAAVQASASGQTTSQLRPDASDPGNDAVRLAHERATGSAPYPAWMRITHWLNAIAVLVMIGSGWRIYNASPIFPFKIPAGLTMGGWLGGALQWHFAAMWLLVINGFIYLVINIVSGRLRSKFLPVSVSGFIADMKAALTGHLAHDDLSKYNTVQKIAYLAIIVDLLILVISGLAIWKSVQFPLLRTLMTGYDNARIVHFCAMAFAVAFLVVHLVMVALVPRTLVAMVRGR